MMTSRREVIIALGAVSLAPYAAAGAVPNGSAPLPTIAVTKDPNCSCCTGWVDHLRSAGFPVTVSTTADVRPTMIRLGVPEDLSLCHTAEVDGYVIEGHVPADAMRRLLQERPRAIGLAVPGMPADSPGMGGTPQAFDVILFSPTTRTRFGRYLADKPF
jgi:hypothetical protein